MIEISGRKHYSPLCFCFLYPHWVGIFIEGLRELVQVNGRREN